MSTDLRQEETMELGSSCYRDIHCLKLDHKNNAEGTDCDVPIERCFAVCRAELSEIKGLEMFFFCLLCFVVCFLAACANCNLHSCR